MAKRKAEEDVSDAEEASGGSDSEVSVKAKPKKAKKEKVEKPKVHFERWYGDWVRSLTSGNVSCISPNRRRKPLLRERPRLPRLRQQLLINSCRWALPDARQCESLAVRRFYTRYLALLVRLAYFHCCCKVKPSSTFERYV